MLNLLLQILEDGRLTDSQVLRFVSAVASTLACACCAPQWPDLSDSASCVFAVQGRTVSFRHSLIIMTSNIGSAAIAGGAPAIGVQLAASDADAAAEAAYGHIRACVMQELKVQTASRFHLACVSCMAKSSTARQPNAGPTLFLVGSIGWPTSSINVSCVPSCEIAFLKFRIASLNRPSSGRSC